MNLHEFMCSYEAKNYEKLKQLILTMVFHASKL
jgi:hypothetical protein